jgi:hypothetical protein
LVNAALHFGVAFLFGKHDSYLVVGCPDCHKDSLFSAPNDRVDAFRLHLFDQAGRIEVSNQPRLQYNAFPYNTDQLPAISQLLKGRFVKPLSGNTASISQDGLEGNPWKEGGSPEAYCSYRMGDAAMGPAIAVWWYSKEDVEKLVNMENESGLRIFPRYMLYNPLLLAIQNLCWKHGFSSSPISGLELSAYPEFGAENGREHCLAVDTARNTEFLSVLKYAAFQSDASRLSRIRTWRLWKAIRKNCDSDALQDNLHSLSCGFIDEFSNMACRTVATQDDAIGLADKYLKMLTKIKKRSWKKSPRTAFRTGLTAHKSSPLARFSNIAGRWIKVPGQEKTHLRENRTSDLSPGRMQGSSSLRLQNGKIEQSKDRDERAGFSVAAPQNKVSIIDEVSELEKRFLP